MLKTVKQMYQKCNISNTPLLSNYSSIFWNEYVNNFSDFDFVFSKLFSSFIYFDQTDDLDIDEVTTDFTNSVYSWLRMNDKRYNELWRINVIPDNNKYSITDNYYLNETYAEHTTGNGSFIDNQRTDVTNNAYGSIHQETSNRKSAFNTSTEHNTDASINEVGTHNDVVSFTKGGQSSTSADSGTKDYTITRSGQIGTMTADDVLKKHNDFWTVYNFYMFVFDDICRNFLMIGGND